MSDDQTWFAVRLIMESEHPEEDVEDRLFEEKIILVYAPTEEAARQKAVRFGQAAEEEYTNPDGKLVKWVFREVLDVKPLFDNVIEDGAE
ncbi:MAG: DUF4288 domain-containing protein, partial [Chloroflexota bacterium]